MKFIFAVTFVVSALLLTGCDPYRHHHHPPHHGPGPGEMHDHGGPGGPGGPGGH
ncbi:hypothetical protein ACYJW8_11130 [Frateuria aurantia]